jgi:hypothetical protein
MERMALWRIMGVILISSAGTLTVFLAGITNPVSVGHKYLHPRVSSKNVVTA